MGHIQTVSNASFIGQYKLGICESWTAQDAAKEFAKDYWEGETPKILDMLELTAKDHETMAYRVEYKHKESLYRVSCIDTPGPRAIWRISKL